MHEHEIIIHGCLLIVNRGPRQLIRRVVTPEWLKLYFMIKIGEFDTDMWNTLPRELKALLGYVCRKLKHPFSDEFNIALATDYKADYERLKLLEGSIKAGNNNTALIDECIKIIQGLGNSGQMNSKTAKTMIRSFMNTRGRDTLSVEL